MIFETDGKFLLCKGRRFPVRGVTYGTFRPREGDGARFPQPARIDEDLAAMEAAGFNVLRTYTTPPADLLDAAERHGMAVLAGVFTPDWRYALGDRWRECRAIARQIVEACAAEAERLRGDERVLGLIVGNEVPADVVRWVGTSHVATTVRRAGEAVRDVDPDRLVTYANFPTSEYLPLETMDFLTFNVFLERRLDFRRYLTRLQHLAGDRPLVLGEIGLDAGTDERDAPGEKRQAEVVDWQLATALERGVAGTCLFSWTDEWHVGEHDVTGWHFGLTRADRSPRLALDVAARWNRATVADLKEWWPSLSVVICAHNEEATLGECLRHTCALDYPDLEIIVVDDGSTDATPEIVARHPRARLVQQRPNAGLGTARNRGYEAATGMLVAYLDADAFPSPEWPYYLALGLDNPAVGGVGGPNVPPADDPPGAHRVAHAPGGPNHVLLADDRAEHIPGCNMAFYRQVLVDAGGCDPIYTAAGDDVDLCWRVQDAGWQISFHPGALVWHRRRAGLRAYLKQQRGYGRAEALVEARHPERFTPVGTARWHGVVYDAFAARLAGNRIYRGTFGSAPFQGVYRSGGHALDLAHQLGLPVAVPAVATAPLAWLHPALGLPAAMAAALLVLLLAVDVAKARPSGSTRWQRARFRLGVAGLHLLEPLARAWGRLRHGPDARRSVEQPAELPGPVVDLGGGVLQFPADRSRPDFVAAVLATLRRSSLRTLPASPWADYDACVYGSALVEGRLTTSAHPDGCVQLRLRPRPRPRALVGFAVLIALTALTGTAGPLAVLAAGAVDGVMGVVRVGSRARRLLGNPTVTA